MQWYSVTAVGSWKLVFGPDKGADEEVQLYDLEADLGEKHNLAAKEPERVTEMRTLMESLIIAGRSTPVQNKRMISA